MDRDLSERARRMGSYGYQLTKSRESGNHNIRDTKLALLICRKPAVIPAKIRAPSLMPCRRAAFQARGFELGVNRGQQPIKPFQRGAFAARHQPSGVVTLHLIDEAGQRTVQARDEMLEFLRMRLIG